MVIKKPRMKRITIGLLIGLMAFAAQAQWSTNGSQLLPKGNKEVGLFAPLKMGLRDSIELKIHPIYFFIMPHVGLKKYWKSFGVYNLMSKHQLAYPSLLYKVIARRGTGGILPATSKIPQMIQLNNSISIGRKFNPNFEINGGIGLDMTFSFGKDKRFPEIEYFFAYPRTYSYNNFTTPYLTLDLNGQLFGRFTYAYDFDAFFLTKAYKGSIIEHRLKVQWNKSDKFAIRVGVLQTSGRFPYGKDNKILPVFDFLFAW